MESSKQGGKGGDGWGVVHTRMNIDLGPGSPIPIPESQKMVDGCWWEPRSPPTKSNGDYLVTLILQF